MRTGLYLAGFTPDVGGGYAFQQDIFRAFLQLADTRPQPYTVLAGSPFIAQYVDSLKPGKNITTITVPPDGKIGGWLRSVRSLSPLMRRVLRRPGNIERTARRLGLECLWYLGGGCYESTDTPYIATVWDLEHRLQPWFPEMSANGVWDSRETAYRNYLQRASYVIVGTEAGRDQVHLFYQIPISRIRIFPHPTPRFALDGVGGNATIASEKYGINSSYLLYPAQFWPHKNHVNLVLALARLRDAYGMKTTLVFVGSDKGNKAHVEKIVREQQLTQQVHFLGFVEQADLVGLYRGARAMIYPSMCGPENLPPLEAFALGCPVLAGDVPGAMEQLGEAALRFDPASPVDIAEKIMQFEGSDALRSTLQGRGHERAQKWKAEDFVSGVLTLLDEFSAIRRCWPA